MMAGKTEIPPRIIDAVRPPMTAPALNINEAGWMARIIDRVSVFIIKNEQRIMNNLSLVAST